MNRLIFLGVLVLVSVNLYTQTTIHGKVTDSNGEVLVGASISLDDSSLGTITDENGYYELQSGSSLPWNISISYLGYVSKNIIVMNPGEQSTVLLSQANLFVDEIVVSGSRLPERSSQSLSSITVVKGRELKIKPTNGDVSEYLRNVQGVNIIRGGVLSSNIELRGPVNVLESSTLVLRDYAPLTTPSDKIMLSGLGGLSPLDIDRVEVVRGPSGALYGPNVTAGVVHYLTKDAFKHPGVSGLVSAGERNQFTTRFRYAGNNGDRLGWKILFNYNQARDFPIAEDELIANDGTSNVVVPQNFETLGGKEWIGIKNLDDILLRNINFEAGLEYRLNNETKINYTTDFSRGLNNIALPIGFAFLGSQRFEQQLRVNSGKFFASIYHRHTAANVDDSGNPNNAADHAFTLNYTAGAEGQTQLPQIQTAEVYFDASLQYRVDINEDVNIQLGSDFRLSPSFDKPFIYGNSSGDNAYNIYGGYISSRYELSDDLVLNATARVDYFSAYDQSAFSPRIGLVYNSNSNSTLRMSFNRSFQGQSRERTYLDFNFSSILPPFFPSSRIVGVGQPVTYNNPVTRFAFGDVVGGESFQLQDIVDALALHAGVSSPNVSGTVTPNLTTAFFASPGVGFSTGIPISLDEAGLTPPTLRTVNQLEIGYSATVLDKLKINIDVYNTWIENIQPTGEVPLTAGSQLDVASVQNQIEQQVPAGPQRDALIESLNSVPFNPTPIPAFNGTPGYGAVRSDRAQELGYVFEIGFPTYGNRNVNYFGTELSATYLINNDISLFANYSFLSQTVWTAEDLEEKNPDYAYYLNSAPSRINLGLNFYPTEGFYGSFTMNYQSEYEGRQGDGRFFTGINEARSIFDLRLGYQLNTPGQTHIDLSLSIQNVFDKKYSHFVHLPELRRWTSVALKVAL